MKIVSFQKEEGKKEKKKVHAAAAGINAKCKWLACQVRTAASFGSMSLEIEKVRATLKIYEKEGFYKGI